MRSLTEWLGFCWEALCTGALELLCVFSRGERVSLDSDIANAHDIIDTCACAPTLTYWAPRQLLFLMNVYC